MLVVALIGVLLAIALPAYDSWRTRTRTAQAVTDIAAIATRLSLHWQDARSYPASLAEIGMAGTLDPWGNPYQYLNLQTLRGNGHARKDHSLVPINTDFDLYSMGPDGRSVGPLTARASRDDIVRANDGRFIGLASDY